jgi:hypothetical protein
MDQPIVALDTCVRLVPRTVISRRRGQTFQTKISERILREYEVLKNRLYLVTDRNPSQSIIVRRSLDLYLKRVSMVSASFSAHSAKPARSGTWCPLMEVDTYARESE